MPIQQNIEPTPNYLLEVQGKKLESNITQFVQSVEYENADGIVDVARITIANPDFLLSNSKVFMPGNELDIYMGYGSDLSFIGRVMLIAPRDKFPQDGMPMLEVTGYTKDYLMQESKPDPAGKKQIATLEEAISTSTGEKQKKLKAMLKRIKQSTVYRDTSIEEIVEDRCLTYLFTPDIDPVPLLEKKGILQRADMSDYTLIQGLANLTGFFFWVDYDMDEGKGWTLHFRDPTGNLVTQEKQYTFKYNQGDFTTLLNFEPEMMFRNHYTTIRVQSTGRNATSFGKSIEVEIVEELGQEADPYYTGAIEEIEEAPVSAEAYKIYIGDFSFTVNPKVEIKNEAALETWASQWFRRMRENFIVGRGSIIGVETLRAKQIHRLEGIGVLYDGQYYFSRVRHILSADDGYKCNFNVRKVLKGL